jgi:hypothetical protein
VVGWHRAGFRLYWRGRSRTRRGRPKIHHEIRALLGQKATENTGWGAPKIHGEWRKLGFDLSERTVARHLRNLRRRGDPKQRWRAFLANHHMILDHDAKFNGEVLEFLQAAGLKPKRTGVQAPWQNGLAERWVGSIRRELLDQVIPWNEQHLRGVGA